jgi:cation diffusion facilitator CzcD-associated flavoprotein CzcO
VTAHLRSAGLEVRCIGEPLELWRDHMPSGMLLRSRKRSSQIADPSGSLTIRRYESENHPLHDPLSLAEFIDYGLWFQRHAVPDVDVRKAEALHRDAHGFRITLDDGAELTAGRVVVAAGIVPFARRPEPFTGLPRSHVSHAVDHADFGGFTGKRVLVIGAGQSALESAALLKEAGAEVELLVRADRIRWLWVGDPDNSAAVPKPRRADAPTDVGSGLGGWIVAAPDIFRQLPATKRKQLAYNCCPPAASGWLRPRLRDVAVTLERHVVAARLTGEQLSVTLNDGSERSVDHVLLATGYAMNVVRYPFMTAGLASQLLLDDGYPRLGPGLESSIPGLHFVGAPATASFGPIMRFVVGTYYSGPAVARRALGRPQPLVRFSFAHRRLRPNGAAHYTTNGTRAAREMARCDGPSTIRRPGD